MCIWEPAPGPINGGTKVGSIMGARRGDGGGYTPGQCRIPAEGTLKPKPRPIRRLCLLTDKNTRWMCCNIALPIPGGSAFYKRCHMGFTCFEECPRKGSHIHALVLVTNEVDLAMATAWDPAPVADLEST